MTITEPDVLRVECATCHDPILRSEATPFISYNEPLRQGQPTEMFNCQVCEISLHRSRCHTCRVIFDGRTGGGFCNEGDGESGPMGYRLCPLCAPEPEEEEPSESTLKEDRRNAAHLADVITDWAEDEAATDRRIIEQGGGR